MRLLLGGIVLVLAACHVQTSRVPPVVTIVRSPAGDSLGILTLEPTASGLRIAGTLRGLPPGAHGIHLHGVGRCDPPDFATAGGHFNPTSRQHGLENPMGPHAGDLPNITVTSAREGQVTLTTTRMTLEALRDADGAAIVIHAVADDQRTDPAGNSGARIACGIIR